MGFYDDMASFTVIVPGKSLSTRNLTKIVFTHITELQNLMYQRFQRAAIFNLSALAFVDCKPME